MEDHMSERRFTFDFLEGLHNKESFFERITDDSAAGAKSWNHLILMVLFAFGYGLVMGAYNGWEQALASAIKMPLLFLLIVLICFPAFFVIQAALGSSLTLRQIFSVIMNGFVLITAIMLSFAPIAVFFMITGGDYEFIKLLHVAIFIVSGLFGMRTIVEALKYACEKKSIYPRVGVQVFKFWIVILAFVGAQLSWSLRPFVGDKNLPFTIFREQGGNLYESVFNSIHSFFSGDSGSDAENVK
jgi:hypothetical protein